jgi:hypothetical protein
MNVIFAGPNHFYWALRVLRHEPSIDNEFLIEVASPPEAAAQQGVIQFDFVRRGSQLQSSGHH